MAATRRLAAAGVEQPRAEARLLLEVATGLARERQLAEPERPLTPTQSAALARAVARRAAREPFAYIAGGREFYGQHFAVGPGVLVPRPETETLVDAAAAAFPNRAAPLRVLDMGTGSGCLLLSVLALYPRASGVGTDASSIALTTAAANAEALGLSDRVLFRHTSWGEGVEPAFDLILSNPPYIATGDLAGLEPELALHEPRLALDGGPDGLGAYRALTPDLLRLLAPSESPHPLPSSTGQGGGTAQARMPPALALLEIGQGQAEALTGWFEQHGFTVTIHADLAGVLRCLELRAGG